MDDDVDAAHHLGIDAAGGQVEGAQRRGGWRLTVGAGSDDDVVPRSDETGDEEPAECSPSAGDQHDHGGRIYRAGDDGGPGVGFLSPAANTV